MFINSKRSISPVDYIAFNVKLATTSDFFFFFKQLPVGFRLSEIFFVHTCRRGKIRNCL